MRVHFQLEPGLTQANTEAEQTSCSAQSGRVTCTVEASIENLLEQMRQHLVELDREKGIGEFFDP